MMKKLVITCGDINGIGPEIIVKMLSNLSPSNNHKIILVIPYNVFLEACELTSVIFPHASVKSIDDLSIIQNNLVIYDIGKVKTQPGKESKKAAEVAHQSLEVASTLAASGIADAIITAPISKSAMNLIDFKYPGHTEYFADKFNTKSFGMFFLSSKMKAALATIHLPIKDVSSKLTLQSLNELTDLVVSSLKKDFAIKMPKVAMLGLNPHAGENGFLGSEEITVLSKVIKQHKSFVEGPFVPDAFFGKKLYKNYDLVIGMYHDQLLIPFKMLDFSNGVNYTAGLPVVRTSPDHGTGFDIAWKNIANSSSIESAFKWAVKISSNRKKL